jgi:hypothetical protein
MAETARGRAFIATMIKNDPTVQGILPDIANRIFDRPAPQGQAYPYVRMDVLSAGSDLIVLGGARVWASPLILVYVATNKQSTGAIEPLADRIDALLHRASGTVTSGVIWSVIRERGFDTPDASVVPNVSRLGGEYRMLVSNA